MALKQSFNKREVVWSANSLLGSIRNQGISISYWAKLDPVAAFWNFATVAWYETGYPLEGDANHFARLPQQIFPGGTANKLNFDHYRYNQDGSLVGNSRTGDINNADQWHHYAWAFAASGATVDLFVDGVLKLNNMSLPDVDTGLFCLGAMITAPANADQAMVSLCANALYADLIAWDGELVAADALALYASGAPTYSRAAISFSGISHNITLRCPLIDDLVDIVSGDPVLSATQMPRFEDDSDLFPGYSGQPIRHTNPGVCGRALLDVNRPRTWISLSDSFGSMVKIRVPGPLYDQLSFGKFGRAFTPAASQLWSRSTTGFSGTSQTVSSANNHRVESSTTRTVTASSWSAGVLSLTYDGPNVAVGDCVKVSSGYYRVLSFTAGSGTGTSQTDAVITCSAASDPGDLSTQNIAICFIAGMGTTGFVEQYNQTGTRYQQATLSSLTGYPTVTALFSGGGTERTLLDHTKPTKVRLYHRVASDATLQVKSVKIQRGTPDSYEDVETVSNLDDANHAGQVRLLSEFTIEAQKQVAGSGKAGYSLDILPTGTASDSADRYFTLVGIEFEQDANGLRIIDLTEASWSFNGFGSAAPGFKSMDQATIERLVAALGNREEEHVITITGDIEDRTPAEWLEIYEQTREAWDEAFRKAGLLSPKYLAVGMWMHASSSASGSIDLADWRHRFEKQNRGAMLFAQRNPDRVEFLSAYEATDGFWALPCPSEDGVLSPAPLVYYTNQPQYDIRYRPHTMAVTDATWTNGTLTLAKTGAFAGIPIRPGASYVYVRQTALAATPVVNGWYQIDGATEDALTLASSITGGAAGVGADVAIDAISIVGNGLHPSATTAAYLADAIAATLKANALVSEPQAKALERATGVPRGKWVEALIE